MGKAVQTSEKATTPMTISTTAAPPNRIERKLDSIIICIQGYKYGQTVCQIQVENKILHHSRAFILCIKLKHLCKHNTVSALEFVTPSAANISSFEAIRVGMEKTVEGDEYLEFLDETLE